MLYQLSYTPVWRLYSEPFSPRHVPSWQFLANFLADNSMIPATETGDGTGLR